MHLGLLTPGVPEDWDVGLHHRNTHVSVNKPDYLASDAHGVLFVAANNDLANSTVPKGDRKQHRNDEHKGLWNSIHVYGTEQQQAGW